MARGPSAFDSTIQREKFDAVIVADPTYATKDVYGGEPLAVLIGDTSKHIDMLARRFLNTPQIKRPLLMYSVLHTKTSSRISVFEQEGLPYPIPILPLLSRSGLYSHDNAKIYPTAGVFMTLLAAALRKHTLVAGVDLYRHPSGHVYVDKKLEPDRRTFWPEQHSKEIEMTYLLRSKEYLGDKLTFVGVAADALTKQGQNS